MQDNVTQAEKAWHKHKRSPYAKSAAEDEKHAFLCGFQAAHRLASTAQPEVKGLVEAAFLEGYAMTGPARLANHAWEESEARAAAYHEAQP